MKPGGHWPLVRSVRRGAGEVSAAHLPEAAGGGRFWPHEAQGIGDHGALNGGVERGLRLEGRRVVDLHQPRPRRRVEQQVVAKHLRGIHHTADGDCLGFLTGAPLARYAGAACPPAPGSAKQ